jgi:hypothetical protein
MQKVLATLNGLQVSETADSSRRSLPSPSVAFQRYGGTTCSGHSCMAKAALERKPAQDVLSARMACGLPIIPWSESDEQT